MTLDDLRKLCDEAKGRTASGRHTRPAKRAAKILRGAYRQALPALLDFAEAVSDISCIHGEAVAVEFYNPEDGACCCCGFRWTCKAIQGLNSALEAQQ